MGANPTQARGVCLFFVAFLLIAAGFAADINYFALALGVAALGVSCMLFLKAKPWEHNEE